MSRVLRFGRKAALSGQAKSLVIFVHGYGADGADLLSLADVLGPHLPNTAFVGFSQGAMLSLHMAPRRAEPIAAVIAISGQLLQPERLVAETSAKPPVLVMHGDRDEVVPFPEMTATCNALVGAGFETYGHVMEGAGHTIAQDGLATALAFLTKTLPN